MSAAASLAPVAVVSDVVCPWCFIGKRWLEQAAAAGGIPLAVRWRPYQLDASIPSEGTPSLSGCSSGERSEARGPRGHRALPLWIPGRTRG